MRTLGWIGMAMAAGLACASVAMAQDTPSVSFRIVLENPEGGGRGLDATGTSSPGLPWAFEGRAGCGPSFACPPDVSAVSWRGQALATAAPTGEVSVRIQATLTEHAASGDRVRSVEWEGPASTVYPEKQLGRHFRFLAASRRND